MQKTRAMRRHHMCRMKSRRAHDFSIGDGSKRHLGIHYQTPSCCSCWICTNHRTNHGQHISEVRERMMCIDTADGYCLKLNIKKSW